MSHVAADDLAATEAIQEMIIMDGEITITMILHLNQVVDDAANLLKDATAAATTTMATIKAATVALAATIIATTSIKATTTTTLAVVAKDIAAIISEVVASEAQEVGPLTITNDL